MNDIRDLFPGRMRERAFQLKARRDTGVAWHEPQFVECKQCGRRATRQIWAKSLFVCPNCGNHQPIGAYYRLSLVLDSGSFRELDAELAPQDVLGFPGYTDKLSAQTQKTGLSEAAVAAVGRIGGVSVVAAVLDSRFFMGSMSTAVGEKITRAIEYAAAKKLPLVIFSASGGARMQEGIFSLMQMAKPSAAIERFSAVHQCVDPSHYRRRYRQLCQPWRHHAGRAGRTHRFCRPPRHRADHRRAPARGLPAQRVPAGTRLCRQGRTPQ